jgi:hypothetical protein
VVFYLPGYDPFPPRRYRELYRREAAAQSAVSGHRISIARVASDAGPAWTVASRIEGVDVETEVRVLVWSDLVRASMGQGIGATYVQLARTAWVYVSTGAIFRVARLRKGPTIAALYPVGMLLAQLALAMVAGWIAARGAAALMDLAGGPHAATAVAALATGASVLGAVLGLFRRMDGRFYAYYLMHDYAHSASCRGAYPDDLSARLCAFVDRIGTARGEGVDEVLVVGHSSGAHIAVTVLADLIRRDGEGSGAGPALSLLTLGHVVPMVSFLPDAVRLRGDLGFLSARGELTWVDVTAPGDGCAFALCDPVAVSGVAPPGKRWPLVLSAAFSQTLSPETWARLRWRFFRLHFQYLCAFDRPGDYDYFAITGGPMTLGARYAGRSASPSRIETPMSGYRSTGRAR